MFCLTDGLYTELSGAVDIEDHNKYDIEINNIVKI